MSPTNTYKESSVRDLFPPSLCIICQSLCFQNISFSIVFWLVPAAAKSIFMFFLTSQHLWRTHRQNYNVHLQKVFWMSYPSQLKFNNMFGDSGLRVCLRHISLSFPANVIISSSLLSSIVNKVSFPKVNSAWIDIYLQPTNHCNNSSISRDSKNNYRE